MLGIVKDVAKKAGIVAASQAPLAGGFALWWEQAQQNPVLAFLLTAVYEIIIFPLWLFIKAFRDELQRRSVEKAPEAGKQAATWVIDRLVAEAQILFSGFRRRYVRWLIRENGMFNVRGLGLTNTYDLKLDDVFVELRIDPKANPARPLYDPIAVKELQQKSPEIWTYLRAKAYQGVALVIKGPPGCGKTTLLQHLALAMATGRRDRGGMRLHFPILLFLRNHVEALTRPDKPPGLGELAQSYFSNSNKHPDLKPPKDWFEKRLKRNRCLVLLDGLDEVAELEKRQAIAKWVGQQVRDYPRCRFVLSSRPGGYKAAPLDNANELEVLPFNYSQVQKFVGNWYLANAIMSAGGKRTKEVEYNAKKDAQDLIRRLDKATSLRALTANPLLLNMIALVHRYMGALPGSRVELYDEICKVLLGKWQLTKGLTDNLRPEQKRLPLQHLAACMMEAQERDIATAAAMPVITPLLVSIGLDTAKIENFLLDTRAAAAFCWNAKPIAGALPTLLFRSI